MSEHLTCKHVWLSNGQCTHCGTTKERHITALESALAEAQRIVSLAKMVMAEAPSINDPLWPAWRDSWLIARDDLREALSNYETV